MTAIPILQGSYLAAEAKALVKLDLDSAPSRFAKATVVLCDLPDNESRKKFALRLGRGAVREVATAADRYHEGNHEAARADSRVQAVLSIVKRLTELTAPTPISGLSIDHFKTGETADA